MTRAEHKAYVDAIKRIENEFGAVTDFTLTEQEQIALRELPEEIMQMHEELLSRYVPFSENADFRDAAYQKFIALVIIARPQFERAYKIGREAGRG